MDIVTNSNDNRAVCHLLIYLIKICNEHDSFRNKHGTQNIIASGLLQLFEIHQNLHFSTSASISCAKFRNGDKHYITRRSWLTSHGLQELWIESRTFLRMMT